MVYVQSPGQQETDEKFGRLWFASLARFHKGATGAWHLSLLAPVAQPFIRHGRRWAREGKFCLLRKA